MADTYMPKVQHKRKCHTLPDLHPRPWCDPEFTVELGPDLAILILKDDPYSVPVGSLASLKGQHDCELKHERSWIARPIDASDSSPQEMQEPIPDSRRITEEGVYVHG